MKINKIINELKLLMLAILSFTFSIIRAIFCPIIWKIRGKNSSTLIESYKLVIKGIQEYEIQTI